MNVDNRTLEEIHEQAQRERIAQKFGVDHFTVWYWYQDAMKNGYTWDNFYHAMMDATPAPKGKT